MRDQMKCRRVINQLNAFADKELSSEDMKLVTEHLLACQKCRKEHDYYLQINNILDSKQTGQLPLKLREKLVNIPRLENRKVIKINRIRRFSPVPAAAAILLTLFSAVLLGRSYLKISHNTQTGYENYQLAQESFYRIWEEITYE